MLYNSRNIVSLSWLIDVLIGIWVILARGIPVYVPERVIAHSAEQSDYQAHHLEQIET